ncbi:MAG: hypothetical protein JXA92_00880 [candidate division Zixibacteria bacterium]|nr:hypothetical protein [candidate division Zixibacteria bacterium]
MWYLKLMVSFLAVIVLMAGPVFAQHYYGGGHAIPLKVDSSKVTIKFDSGLGSIERQTLLLDIDHITEQLVDNHTIDGFVACSLSTGDDYDDFIDSVAGLDGVYLVEPYYLNQLDSAFLVGTRFCVAFDEALTLSEINDINTSAENRIRPVLTYFIKYRQITLDKYCRTSYK